MNALSHLAIARRIVPLVALLATAGHVVTARAQTTYTWDGGGGDNN